MFPRLENWLILKTYCFLFYFCKDNTKSPNYVVEHGFIPVYLTNYVCLFSKLTLVKCYHCKNDT